MRDIIINWSSIYFLTIHNPFIQVYRILSGGAAQPKLPDNIFSLIRKYLLAMLDPGQDISPEKDAIPLDCLATATNIC